MISYLSHNYYTNDLKHHECIFFCTKRFSKSTPWLTWSLLLMKKPWNWLMYTSSYRSLCNNLVLISMWQSGQLFCITNASNNWVFFLYIYFFILLEQNFLHNLILSFAQTSMQLVSLFFWIVPSILYFALYIHLVDMSYFFNKSLMTIYVLFSCIDLISSIIATCHQRSIATS